MSPQQFNLCLVLLKEKKNSIFLIRFKDDGMCGLKVDKNCESYKNI